MDRAGEELSWHRWEPCENGPGQKALNPFPTIRPAAYPNTQLAGHFKGKQPVRPGCFSYRMACP